jgi:predicted dehydrogenase
LKPGRLEFIKKDFPFVDITNNYKEIIEDKSINAVCIATPVTTHKAIAEEALNAGKHVFVEKPMTINSDEASCLVDTADRLNKILAVGHVFQFAPAVRKIKQLLQSNTIGKVMHITSTRINLGPPETEVDVIWDLGPHDFSIILYLLEESPMKVQSIHNSYSFGNLLKNESVSAQLTNNAHISIEFKSGITSHIHLSWLSSNKMRLMQIFGTEGSIVYDEMLALDGKVKLYGKGIDNRISRNVTDVQKLGYQTGDIHIIPLEQHEPLRMECEEFISSIINNTKPVNNGYIGLEVIKLLEISSKPFKSKTS